MSAPKTLLISDEQVGLATDLYEITMAAAYFETGLTGRADFELFVRSLPPGRGYLVAAGLEQALAYLAALRFGDDEVAFLRGHPGLAGISDGFFDRLRAFRFTGDVWAVPEGTVVFAEEPILRIRAPIIEAQIVETFLLTTITFQTMVATKASRVVSAAGGRGVVDFGSRRAHGPQAGVLAARAAYLAGCDGTSNVLAGHLMDIPTLGTAAHSWTMAHTDETDAFRNYVRVFPDSSVLLVDTYDTIAGVRRAIETAGEKLKGVRLDSGDLVALSRQARRMLDEAGLSATRIIASGNLNEYRLAEIAAAGAPIDAFGVGTDLVTSRDAAALGGVYKLVAVERGGRWEPCLKHSAEKASHPWPKQVYRASDEDGRFVEDVIARADETHPGEALLGPVVTGGRMVGEPPALHAIRERVRDQLARLDETCRRLRAPSRYPVRFSAVLARAAEGSP